MAQISVRVDDAVKHEAEQTFDEIGLSMSADTAETRTLLRASSIGLRRQLDEAGLTLGSIGVDASDDSDERPGDGQTGE